MARGTWGGALERQPCKVKISWTNGINIQQTGFHLRSVGANFTDPEEVANEVLGWVTSDFRNILTEFQTVVGIDVVDLVTFEGFSISPAALAGTVVSAESADLPSYVCTVVGMKGELRTRYGQGRMFWPVTQEAFSNRDRLAAPGVAALQGAIDAMAALWIGNDLTGHNLINVHGVIPPKAATPTRPAQPEVPPSWYDVTSLRLNTITTFLRSRKAGVGS